MDPNQNINPSASTAVSAPQSGSPQPGSLANAQSAPPPPPQNPQPSEGSKINGKVILFIVVGILLLITLGVTYFMAQQLNPARQESITPTPTQVPTPTSTPTPTPLSEKDIDTIDLGDPDTDLKTIDDDVKQL